MEDVLDGVYEWEGRRGWPSTKSNKLGLAEKLFYMQNQKQIQDVWNLIQPKKVKDKTLERIGPPRDGGYVMVDELIDQGDKIAYSYGVGGKIVWEMMIRNRGYEVHCYDPTVSSLPCKKTDQDNIMFHKIGITDRNGEGMCTIEQAIIDNGHEDKTDMLMQCDIEGFEWPVFANTPQRVLNKFSQIIIECHWLLNQSTNLSSLLMCKRALQNLNKNFTPYHIHANNACGFFMVNGKKVPEVFEISYVRNDLCEFTDETLTFPTDIDEPNSNNVTKPEIELGEWGWND